jgi:hypothetical protein
MNITIMRNLIMKKVTPIDLVDSSLSADQIVLSTPPNAEGVFRRVYVGNYRVLKRAKSVIPKLWVKDDRDTTACRFNLVEADNFKRFGHLNILAKVEWVSQDGRYLVMEKMEMSEFHRIQAVKSLFSHLWVDGYDGNWQAAVDCCERLRVSMRHYYDNNFDISMMGSLMQDPAWDRKVYWGGLPFDKGIYKLITELPYNVAIDLHYNNWGLDTNGNLKIIDYAGC